MVPYHLLLLKTFSINSYFSNNSSNNSSRLKQWPDK